MRIIIFFIIFFHLLAEAREIKKSPINISADELQVNKLDRIAIFKRNVEAHQEGIKLYSDIMKLYYSKEGKDIEKIIAIDKVRMVTQAGQVVTSNRAIYDLTKDVITLTGKVILQENGNILKGERLTYDLQKELVHITSDQKVKILLERNAEN